VVSYDCDIGDTCASLCCRDQFRDDIIPRLLAMKSSANLPHLLAFIFTARYLEAVEKLFYSRPVHGMMVVQDELGVGSYLRVDSAEAKTLDLRDMPGTLVSLDHFVTTLRLSESTAVKLINSLTSLIDDFDTLDPGGINMKLCVRTSVLQLEVDELGAQIRAMKEGVQSMVQMVCLTSKRTCNRFQLIRHNPGLCVPSTKRQRPQSSLRSRHARHHYHNSGILTGHIRRNSLQRIILEL
jgi:hypothetical protein